MPNHYWLCEECAYTIDFEEPELPQDDPRSEQNDDRQCPLCDAEMFYDEYLDESYIPLVIQKNLIKQAPITFSADNDETDNQFVDELFSAHGKSCECHVCQSRKGK